MMLNVKVPQRNGPARLRSSKAHSQQNKDFSPLKELIIPAQAAADFFKRSHIFYILICFTTRMYDTNDISG